MIGPLTIGLNAAKAGYERFGVPGAVAAGAVGIGGYAVAKRALRSGATPDEEVDA